MVNMVCTAVVGMYMTRFKIRGAFGGQNPEKMSNFNIFKTFKTHLINIPYTVSYAKFYEESKFGVAYAK